MTAKTGTEQNRNRCSKVVGKMSEGQGSILYKELQLRNSERGSFLLKNSHNIADTQEIRHVISPRLLTSLVITGIECHDYFLSTSPSCNIS